MNYIALLRGINVGGKSRVEMKRLAHAFEKVGLVAVRTYINSGNVVFQSEIDNISNLRTVLEAAIEDEFGFHVDVLVKTHCQLERVVESVPSDWRNDVTMKCDVAFLWEDLSAETVVAHCVPRPEYENVLVQPGVLVWKVDRENATKSRLTKVVGTPLYAQMTIRNINTVRKLLELCSQN